MNARQELKTKIEQLTENELVHDVVKEFVDDMESKFNDIANLLSSITIDTLENIDDACDLAKDAGTSIY